MKKLFSFIMVALMSVMTLNAENMRIYCKMEQGWWKADGAAVGCHSWGNPGPGTNWPGVRMTPVEGETDMWYIDLNTANVQNVIFTRVNASGAIADRGAKTKDQKIPTNGNNLFTITTSSAVWGDPGCDGTWSKYEVPVPATPTVTDITITGDKYVGTELTFAATVAGFSANPYIIYLVKAEKGEYVQAQGGKFTPTAAGNYTVKADASYQPEDGDAEEATKEQAFTITEAPKVGIIVNVTVPAGTPACYFYGEMSNNSFVEMTKVDETHYTINFPKATTIGWGYKFVWEEGNWNTNNSDPEGDIKVEPKDGVVNVEVKAWATAPGTKYEYTKYTEWQVKYGPKWEFVNMTKQEDGTFTVSATWGNTGMNIKSGTNPIKQDWYPLDDAALTVEQGVAEGDNVVITLTVVNDNTVSLNVAKSTEPIVTKYYVTGNEALVGKDKAWNEKAIEMTDGSYIFKELGKGEYQLKVTDGTWDHSWGYSDLSKTVATEGLSGDKDNNICFTVYTPNDVTVTLTEGHIVTVTGDFKNPQPVETVYYLKNNWNGVAEWSWKAMKAAEEGYVLDSVIFGGKGVNLNTKEDDANAVWFGMDKLKYNETDTIQALDTVRFELAISKEDTVLIAILLGRPVPAPRKEFVFVAGAVAENNPTMFAITWGKGSNETVKMTKKGAEALYTANILETVDSVVLVRCATDATDIIWDGEGKNVWNQTDNYELCDTMNFVGWVDGSNLFTIACSTPKPVETVYYLKNNWNGGEWGWKAMKAAEEGYVLDSVIFGGKGVNLNTKEDDANAVWFGMDKLKYNETDTIQALDTVRFELAISKEDTVLIAILLGRPVPAPRKEFVFVAGAAAESNPTMFAITWGKDGSNETVKMAKKGEEALYTADVLETVDSVVLVRCATDAAEIIWDGEGKNVWNQTDNYEMCDTMKFVAWVDGSNRFTIACSTPKPVEVKYFAKNNWNGAAADDWSWLELVPSTVDDVYMLDTIVFGGTGVNVNNKADDAGAIFIAADKIVVLNVELDGLPTPYIPRPVKRDTVLYAPARMGAVLEAPKPLAGDTIKLFFNATDSTLSAFIIGRPEPVETKYYITGNEALCGEKAWNPQAIEMKNGTHTFEGMAAGEYEMKITNGAWEPDGQSWGSAALSEECSAGVDDKGGNIHFIVETPNNVVVSFAEGKVTVTGTFKESPVGAGITVNVTVPANTPACYFYGEMSNNSFVAMTKVDDTHYTVNFPKATSIGWGYKFVWESGNWSTCNSDPEGDIKVEPVEGVINVEVKAWATNPGTEYKYTTYTEWQVKYGPDWEWVTMTKQEDGTFTVSATWGNTGINIASGENPIKKDWYPLDDAALTVDAGIVEGDNVTITLTVVDDETVSLHVSKPTSPTALEAIMLNGGLKKFMLDGQMYILRNNHLYNAAGNLLK